MTRGRKWEKSHWLHCAKCAESHVQVVDLSMFHGIQIYQLTYRNLSLLLLGYNTLFTMTPFKMGLTISKLCHRTGNSCSYCLCSLKENKRRSVCLPPSLQPPSTLWDRGANFNCSSDKNCSNSTSLIAALLGEHPHH